MKILWRYVKSIILMIWGICTLLFGLLIFPALLDYINNLAPMVTSSSIGVFIALVIPYWFLFSILGLTVYQFYKHSPKYF